MSFYYHGTTKKTQDSQWQVWSFFLHRMIRRATDLEMSRIFVA